VIFWVIPFKYSPCHHEIIDRIRKAIGERPVDVVITEIAARSVILKFAGFWKPFANLNLNRAIGHLHVTLVPYLTRPANTKPSPRNTASKNFVKSVSIRCDYLSVGPCAFQKTFKQKSPCFAMYETRAHQRRRRQKHLRSPPFANKGRPGQGGHPTSGSQKETHPISRNGRHLSIIEANRIYPK